MEEPFTEGVDRHCRQPQEWQNVAWLKFFEIGEAVGIVATLFVVFYFSRKQMQKISVDIETKVPSDLDEKINVLTRMTIEKPQLMRAVSNVESYHTEEMVFAYHLLYTFAHAYQVYERKVVSTNEWTGGLAA